MKIILLYIFTLSNCLVICSNAQTICTAAGGGLSILNGVPSTSARLFSPQDIAIDKWGNLYYADILGCVVRKIDTSNIIFTVAGNGSPGFGGDNGPASSSILKYPTGVVCDTFGNLYIADHQNYRIRKVDVGTGIISTFAGIGLLGDSGDGDSAIYAKFFPCAIHFDKFLNMYISDNEHNKVRKINALGIITTFAGSGTLGFSGDSGLATAAKLAYPTDITSDEYGSIYINDADNKRVRKVDSLGIIVTIAGTGFGIYNGDGQPAINSNLNPWGITYNNHALFISDDSNQRIRKVDFSTDSNIIHTIAGDGVAGFTGDGGTPIDAELNQPAGIAIDNCGSIFFGDENNYRIRKITFNDSCSTHPTQVKELVQTSGLVIYPNPAQSILEIEAPEDINAINIYDAIGKEQLKLNTAGKHATIDIKSLRAGIYFVCVNGVVWRRFLKE